jgi:hypothetical protein
MTTGKTTEDTKKLLKASLLYFACWLLVAFVLAGELSRGGGINHLINTATQGNYYPSILCLGSIIFLALFLKNIALYLKSKNTNDTHR